MTPDQLKVLRLLASGNHVHGWTCRQIGLALGTNSQWAVAAIRPLMNAGFVQRIESGYRVTEKGTKELEGSA